MSPPAEARPFGKRLQWRIEAAALQAAAALFRAPSIDAASGFAGRVAAFVGPRLPFDRRARINMDWTMPEAPEADRARWRRSMYENFGRAMVEYLHLPALAADESRILIEGAEHLAAAKAAGRGAIIATAHYGNWEAVRLAGLRLGWPVGLIYRAFNNPLVDAEAMRVTQAAGGPVVTRGGPGLRRFVRRLKEGGAMMLLADQRMIDGTTLPFLERPALTSTAAADIALATGAALIPARATRLEGARFRVDFEAPIPPPEGLAAPEAARQMMTALNERYGVWLRERPDQWFWLHMRWGRSPEKGAAT